MRALLDTSVFVATESGRPINELPEVDQTEISVMTLAELTIGVLVATDDSRAHRLGTLSALEETFDPLPVNSNVARCFARLVSDLRTKGQRVGVVDALIAATAISEEIPVVTQDRDFREIPRLEVVLV